MGRQFGWLLSRNLERGNSCADKNLHGSLYSSAFSNEAYWGRAGTKTMAATVASDCVHSNHVVQFYSDDTFLLADLSRSIGTALAEGSAAIVIATKARRDELAHRLTVAGYDIHPPIQEQRFLLLDSTETLSKFMINGLPDATRFRNIVGEIVAEATASANGDSPRVVAFGEMVAELFAAGNAEAAVQLEQLWNELARTYSFSLHCAYPLSSFSRVEHAESLMKICAEHTSVIPEESYTNLLNDGDRGRAITELQQKARYLETEMAERLSVQRELLTSQQALQKSHSDLEKRVEERTRELLAVQNALRLLSHRLLTVRDEERRRLAKELHDSTSQILAALQINLATIVQSEAYADSSGASKLRETFHLADKAMRDVRRLSYRLHPPLLEEPGLQFALQWYIAGFAERTKIDVQFDVPQDLQRLPHDLELAVFRIAEQALDNVHRHSGSRTARVRLAIRENKLDLRIEDSGKGIDRRILNGSQSELLGLGSGITGMIERVKQFGGAIVICSAEPGTSIRITLPADLDKRDQESLLKPASSLGSDSRTHDVRNDNVSTGKVRRTDVVPFPVLAESVPEAN
jgi:signal transduction histidine kinase